jgi:hypothetical protein
MKPGAFMTAVRRPLSARIKVRRSTALMLVLFLGLGALWLAVKAPSTSSAAATKVTGLQPGERFTLYGSPTTVPHATVTTTTLTAPAQSTTTVTPPTVPEPPANTTTTTSPPATPSTTRAKPATTITTLVAPTSTAAPAGPPTTAQNAAH